MSLYKITFTPSGPYFFGNEKAFAFDAKKKETPLYFIKGEKMPYQTTLFGSLRYLLLPHKGFDKLNDKENIAAIGRSSFNIEHNDQTPQSFGYIKGMSAVLLCRGDELFIPTPFDHNTKTDSKEYTPFTDYTTLITADDPESFYPIEYDAKKGLTDSFMSLEDLHLETDLFTSDVRIGINRSNTNDRFFKREFICLKKDFSFCVFAELEGVDPDGVSEVVTMGQNKVPFAVKFKKTESGFVLTDKVKTALEQKPVPKDRIYCLSDILTGDDLYKGHHFAIVKTRDFRNLQTTSNGFVKINGLCHPVSAGSVFFPKESVSEICPPDNSQKNAQTIGLNQIVTVKGVTQ